MNNTRRILTLLSLALLLLAGNFTFPFQPQQIDIPWNQTLVLSGGESTNPRAYDPATTHGSGDKLVYSGLVSFDPHLNLTPDLAESWEVQENGTVYIFHLRQSARFHDGRPVTAGDVIYSWERAAIPPSPRTPSSPTWATSSASRKWSPARPITSPVCALSMITPYKSPLMPPNPTSCSN
jgi:ABC-type transport system substrate-binding protein